MALAAKQLYINNNKKKFIYGILRSCKNCLQRDPREHTNQPTKEKLKLSK